MGMRGCVELEDQSEVFRRQIIREVREVARISGWNLKIGGHRDKSCEGGCAKSKEGSET